ncbi:MULTISPECIES: RidA family protein [unclassified Streptomyces]|uniref:RidA family protein n=1 Tax=unclassified Streptomyces TaxID=2593676 RepID=UPI0007ECFDBB|nr:MULTISPECIES: RidA family protein [unclassified Streptomyces]MCP3770238.1 RidA family protein [Streptomyces sp. MAR25Y5]OBQ52024.1 enamine deaminase RidA [Streptomyces sp. H-KF8]
MAITLINPEGLPEIDVYRQVAIASGSRMVFTAGQVAWDADGVTVGAGDLAAQVEQCYLNVATALAAAGATFADAVKLTAYVVDWTPDKMGQFMEGVTRAAQKLGAAPAAPATLVGVQALDIPDHLVEIEAVAVVE